MWERCAHWIFSKKCLAACACPSRLTTLSWPSSSVNRIPSEPSSSNVQKTGPGGGRLPPVLRLLGGSSVGAGEPQQKEKCGDPFACSCPHSRSRSVSEFDQQWFGISGRTA